MAQIVHLLLLGMEDLGEAPPADAQNDRPADADHRQQQLVAVSLTDDYRLLVSHNKVPSDLRGLFEKQMAHL